MKKYIYIILACIIAFSCEEDNLDVLTLPDEVPIDTSYVNPLILVSGSFILDYVNLNRIDTFQAFGFYCKQENSDDYTYLITTDNKNRPLKDFSELGKESNFVSLRWTSDDLIHQAERSLELIATIDFSGENTVLNAPSTITPLAFPTVQYTIIEQPLQNEILKINGNFIADGFLSDGTFLTTINARFNISKLSRVNCN